MAISNGCQTTPFCVVSHDTEKSELKLYVLRTKKDTKRKVTDTKGCAGLRVNASEWRPKWSTASVEKIQFVVIG